MAETNHDFDEKDIDKFEKGGLFFVVTKATTLSLAASDVRNVVPGDILACKRSDINRSMHEAVLGINDGTLVQFKDAAGAEALSEKLKADREREFADLDNERNAAKGGLNAQMFATLQHLTELITHLSNRVEALEGGKKSASKPKAEPKPKTTPKGGRKDTVAS